MPSSLKKSVIGTSKARASRCNDETVGELSPLSIRLLEGEFGKGDNVLVEVQDDQLVFSLQDKAEVEAVEDEPAVSELAAS